MKFSMGFLNRVLPKNRFLGIYGEFFTIKELFKIIKIKFSNSEYFTFKNEKLKYFYHSYNNHRLTERAIEIPIIVNYLEKTKIRHCLEIGNVSNHYYTVFMDLIDSKIVIDKYEKGFGVINKDIKDYAPHEKFNFIFSISTFEHMDSDRGRNPEYINGKSKSISFAADNILYVCENLLESGGYFIITAPMGYSSEWDKTIFSTNIINSNVLNVKSLNLYFFKKISEIEWCKTNANSAKNAKYGNPFPGVNIISILEIIK
jgi:hypothetical protein